MRSRPPPALPSRPMSYRPTAATIAKNHAQHADGRECRICHEFKPPSELKSSYRLIQNECKACAKARGNGQMLAYDNLEIDCAPDPAPAIQTRRLLAVDRQQGMKWSSSRFLEIVTIVSEPLLDEKDARGWRYALHSTEDAWRLSYERSGAPSLLTADLCA